MNIWIWLGLLFIPVALGLVWPLLRHADMPLPSGAAGAQDDAAQLRLDERQRLLRNLRSLRADYAEGKLTESDFLSLEREIQQQLAPVLEAAESLSAAAVKPRSSPLRRAGTWALLWVLGVGAVSAALFERIWRPLPVAGQAQAMPDVDVMMRQLEERLSANPNDLAGWLMLGRSYASLEQPEQAIRAWRKALALKPDEYEARAGMVVMLLRVGDEPSTREAQGFIAELRKQEPDESAWLWYEGLAYHRLGQADQARASLQHLLTLLPPEGDQAGMVREALRQIGP